MRKASFFRQLTQLCIGAGLFLCSACSSERVIPHYKAPQSAEGRMIGTLHLSDPEGQAASKVNLYQIHKGYALKANLDKDDAAKRKGDLVLSRDKDYRWFAGLQWRFSF